MYSVIESCKHNEIDPGKYISYLLGKLKTAHEGEDLTALLPCYCSL
nr:transposase domain-containing protein [Leyella stercorea]